MSGSSDSESDYVVEEIVDKRIRNGYVEYLLKWKDYSPMHNSWEHEGNLECFELIEAYEERIEREKSTKKETQTTETSEEEVVTNKTDSETTARVNSEEDLETIAQVILPQDSETIAYVSSQRDSVTKPRADLQREKRSGFELGLEPDKIIGASDMTGQLMFLMQWKDGNFELITAKEAKQHCPQVLIDFYESHLFWPTDH